MFETAPAVDTVAMTDTVETFEMPVEAAEAYEAKFVPAMFGEWAPILCDVAGVGPGQRVLDVACGTGIVGRVAAERVGPEGRVAGVDRNPAMLTVARRIAPDVDWQEADAAALPFPDAHFDVVLCQAALMFFPDPAAALAEMARVVEPGGTVACQVWGTLEASLGYARLVEVAARHAGPEAVDVMSSYWVLGNLDELEGRFAAAGLDVTSTSSRLGTAKFASVAECVETEIEATPLGQRIDAAVRQAILDDATEALAPFVTGTGVELPIQGHLVAARRP